MRACLASSSKELVLVSAQPAGDSPDLADEIALETAQVNHKLLSTKLGDKYLTDAHMYWTLNRSESVVYTYTKDSSNERQTAVLSGAPLLPANSNHIDENLGDLQAPAGRDVAAMGLDINGRRRRWAKRPGSLRRRGGTLHLPNDVHAPAIRAGPVSGLRHGVGQGRLWRRRI